MILKELVACLRSGKVLTESQCSKAVESLLNADVADEVKTNFLTVHMQQGLREDELVGFAKAILPRAQQPKFSQQWRGRDIMDCCGTGGGGLNILNVSTGIVFILAAAGVPVVKHGNRGVTKKSGSADVLEALGLKVDLSPKQLEESMHDLGWGFVFVQSYHPSFKAVASVRKKLGEAREQTIFNYLGPLLNPVRPNVQLVGVFQEKLTPLYYSALQRMGCKHPCVVYGTHSDGKALGEVSVTGPNVIVPKKLEFSLPIYPESKLFSLMVSSAQQSAILLEKVLMGSDPGIALQMILRNAALAFTVYGHTSSVAEGQKLAQEMIDSGKAYRLLQRSRGWSVLQK